MITAGNRARGTGSRRATGRCEICGRLAYGGAELCGVCQDGVNALDEVYRLGDCRGSALPKRDARALDRWLRRRERTETLRRAAQWVRRWLWLPELVIVGAGLLVIGTALWGMALAWLTGW